MSTLVCVGEPLVALSATGGSQLELRPWLAGAEVNVAVGASRLGARPAVVGRVGDDVLGRWIVEQLVREGVDGRHVVVDPDRPTGLFVKEVDRDGEPTRRYYRGGSAGSHLAAGDLPERLLVDAGAVVLSGLTALLSSDAEGAGRRALEIAAAAAGLPVLDANLRPGLPGSTRGAEIVGSLLPLARVVLGGEAELAAIAEWAGAGAGRGRKELAERIAALHGRDPLVVVRHRGGAGALCGGEWVERVAPPIVAVVDASGAGDAFTAGFVVARLRHAGIAECLDDGLRCAVVQVATPGDCDGVPRLAGSPA